MIKEEDLNRQIDRIVTHALFKKSKRSVSFLKYICRNSIQGRQNQIKEYSIAVDAFGLSPTFDPQSDPRVRVEARRLRKKLTQYYLQEGRDDPILIRIPKGSYIAEFQDLSDRRFAPPLPAGQGAPKLFRFPRSGFALSLDQPALAADRLFIGTDYLLLALANRLYRRTRREEMAPPLPGDGLYTLRLFILPAGEEKRNLLAEVAREKEGLPCRIYREIPPVPAEEFLPVLDRIAEETVGAILEYCRNDSGGEGIHE